MELSSHWMMTPTSAYPDKSGLPNSNLLVDIGFDSPYNELARVAEPARVILHMNIHEV